MQLNIKSSINRNVAFSRKFFSTFSTANRKGDSSTPDPDPFKVVNDIEVTKHTDAVENLLGGKIQIGKISTGTSATESGTSATESNHALNNDAQCLDHSSITSESTEQSIAKQKKVKRIKNRSNRDVADGCNSNWSIEQIEAYINIGMKPERDHLGRRGQLPSREETTKKVHKVKQVLVTMMMTEARKQEMVEDESGFGDWNSIEMQDLSIRKDGGVDSPGSVLSDCSDKECSECVSSLELDVDDEFLIVADEISVKNRGNELSLSMIENALGQRCSTTDSSGIETSSDGDIDPLACSVDSIENSITGPVVILNDFTYDQINDFFPASSDNVKEESDYVVVKRRKTSKMVNAESNSHSLKTLEEKRKGSLSNFSRMSASKETDKPIEDFTNRIIGNSTLQNSVFLSNKRSKHFKSCDVNKRTLNSEYNGVNIKMPDHANAFSDASTIRLQEPMRKKPSDLGSITNSSNDGCLNTNKSCRVKSHLSDATHFPSETDGRHEISRFCKNGRIMKSTNSGRNTNNVMDDSKGTIMRKEEDLRKKSSFEPSLVLPPKEDASFSSSMNSANAVDDQNVIHFEDSGFDLLGAQIFLYKAFEEVLVGKSQKPRVVVVFDVNL